MFKDLYLFDQMSEDGDFPPIISLNDDELSAKDDVYPDILPILALKNTVLFPGVVLPITIGRDKSIKAVKKAYESTKYIAVLSQKDLKNEDPGPEDLHHLGCVARIIKMLKMPDGSTTAILQGRMRCELTAMTQTEPYLQGSFDILQDEVAEKEDIEMDAIMSSVRDQSVRIIELSPQIPSEATSMLENMSNNSFLINFIASNLNLSIEQKQEILSVSNLNEKGKLVLKHLGAQLQLLELRSKIENKVRVDIEKQQRDYFLNQQLKTIQEELGHNPQHAEISALAKRGQDKKWPDHARDQFLKELNKAKILILK